MPVRLIALMLMILPIFSYSQSQKKDSLWLPFQKLIGTWQGTGEGPNGKGFYERSYRYMLNQNFIEVRNKVVYPANEKSPNGYTHEDVGYISYDKMRKKFVLRQFHSEGFVNQYVVETADGNTIRFISESIENIAAGWRAKETYHISGNSFTEIFELAAPNGNFQPYTKSSFERVTK